MVKFFTNRTLYKLIPYKRVIIKVAHKNKTPNYRQVNYDMKKILMIDFCNYENYPIGGFLSFAKNMISAFGNDLALVGITTNSSDPIGRWFKKDINGKVYDYFALSRYSRSRSKTKHIVPDRLKCYFLLRYYKRKIISKTFNNIMIQRQEVLPAIIGFGFKNVCYCFPGVENPLNISKYRVSHYFASFFEKLFFSSFKDVSTILASADEESINDMIARSKGKLNKKSVIQFPTRINTNIFKPQNKDYAREILNIHNTKTVITTTGRLTELKGWRFMIDCFFLFEKSVPDSIFYIIGEGEDIPKIKDYISKIGFDQKIILTGKKSASEIATFLNASDLFIMGSYVEGWPTSLVEAVGCGIPVVVTKFSAAKEIINESVNGYIEVTRDINKFVEFMQKGLTLNIEKVEVSKYSISTLKDDLLNFWPIY